MDAYYLAEKIKKYWAELYPKNSGELIKNDEQINVYVKIEDKFYQISGVHIDNSRIELELKKD